MLAMPAEQAWEWLSWSAAARLSPLVIGVRRGGGVLGAVVLYDKGATGMLSGSMLLTLTAARLSRPAFELAAVGSTLR